MRQHLETLSYVYPSSKFVSIKGDRCIPDYPYVNQVLQFVWNDLP